MSEFIFEAFCLTLAGVASIGVLWALITWLLEDRAEAEPQYWRRPRLQPDDYAWFVFWGFISYPIWLAALAGAVVLIIKTDAVLTAGLMLILAGIAREQMLRPH